MTPDVSDIAGIYPMLYAFFGADGRLDRAALALEVEAVVRHGAHGVAALGLAGETGKLSLTERRQFLDWVAEALAGRLPLAVTISEPTVEGQLAFARAAAENGARWLVLQPPPVSGAGEAELVRFFGRVAEGATLPVAIQNAPQFLGVGLSNQALKTLNRNHPNVALLKAEGPPLTLRRLIEDTDGAFRVFNGRAGVELTESLRAGCVGLIPGAESFDEQAAIFELMRKGAEAEAEARFRALLPLLAFLMETIDHLLCYGKRVAARRLGLAEVHDRTPALVPHPYGLEVTERLARGLGPLVA
ncbi:MAG: dihydrodipicolinate synthase family protein [Alphaproteobacteria bacterium]